MKYYKPKELAIISEKYYGKTESEDYWASELGAGTWETYKNTLFDEVPERIMISRVKWHSSDSCLLEFKFIPHNYKITVKELERFFNKELYSIEQIEGYYEEYQSDFNTNAPTFIHWLKNLKQS